MTIDQLKVTSQHLAGKAVVYLRQSSPKQVHENLRASIFNMRFVTKQERWVFERSKLLTMI